MRKNIIVFSVSLILLFTSIFLTANVFDWLSSEPEDETILQQKNLEITSTYPIAERIIYSAQGKEQAIVVVFTDSSCGYCRKLHVEIPKLQKAGISIHYIPFPRGGNEGPGYQELQAVWCAKDRNKAMDIAKGALQGQLKTNNCALASVNQGFALGNKLGVMGTPSVLLPTGQIIPGYLPAKRFIDMLGL